MNESRAGAEELWNEAIADSGLNLAKLHRFAHSGQYTVASSSMVSRAVQPRSFSLETRAAGYSCRCRVESTVMLRMVSRPNHIRTDSPTRASHDG